VYDVASALWALQARGDEFLELRERLYALLLPGATAAVTTAQELKAAL
jgi:hypothetical protein